MFDSSRSTARTIRRRSAVAIFFVAAVAGWEAIAGSTEEALGAVGTLAAGPETDIEPESQGDCYDFGVLPDGVSIEGCWNCDKDVHWGWSFWCVDVTLSCDDGEGNSLEIDITDVGLC